MKVEVDDITYTIRFRYDDEHRWTTAKIDEWLGWSDCSSKDVYNKKVGRKIALARAMESAGFSKEIRTKIWNSLKEKGLRLE